LWDYSWEWADTSGKSEGGHVSAELTNPREVH